MDEIILIKSLGLPTSLNFPRYILDLNCQSGCLMRNVSYDHKQEINICTYFYNSS
jgi:hypothetical protein